MEIVPADPRMSNWEDRSPSYLVVFWHRMDQAEEGASPLHGAFEAEEMLITNADVDEVLHWASETAASSQRSYALYGCVNAPQGCGLVRLQGDEPSSKPPD